MGGTTLALMAWLVTCRYYHGIINTQTLVASYSPLAGNATSLSGSAVIAVVLSLIKPDNCDFRGTRSSKDRSPLPLESPAHLLLLVKMIQNMHYDQDVLPTTRVINVSIDGEKKNDNSDSPPVDYSRDEQGEQDLPQPANVRRAFWISTTLIMIISILVPIPLGASGYIFSPGFFTAWMVVAMVCAARPTSIIHFLMVMEFLQIWSFFAGFCCIVLPIWESRVALRQISAGLALIIKIRMTCEFCQPRRRYTDVSYRFEILLLPFFPTWLVGRFLQLLSTLLDRIRHKAVWIKIPVSLSLPCVLAYQQSPRHCTL